jgi:mannose-1-phosphate guanylyltransferase/phosphomannomutase
MSEAGPARRYVTAETAAAIGRPAAFAGSEKRPAIFFDVDGVLNEDPGSQGMLKPEDVVLVPRAGAAVAAARKAGFLTVAITNRPQVARGDITFDDLDRILERLEALLAAQGGALDRIYVCPHHPDAGEPGEVRALKIKCECRKPGALLFRCAMEALPIDPARSMAIGDSVRDIGAARAAGVWAYGVRTGHGCRDVERYRDASSGAPAPDLMFDDVSEAVQFGVSYGAMASPLLEVMRHRPSRTPFMIGIGGRSRSGKSVLAHAVARALRERGDNCLHVRLDDWIMPPAERGAGDRAEIRNRVDRLPAIVAALRGGRPLTAPGYDPAQRKAGPPVSYDPAGMSVIVLDGVFAAHHSVRRLLDLVVFVDAPEPVQRARFDALYRWKGFDTAAIDELWRARSAEEWAVVDAQRSACDLIITGRDGDDRRVRLLAPKPR